MSLNDEIQSGFDLLPLVAATAEVAMNRLREVEAENDRLRALIDRYADECAKFGAMTESLHAALLAEAAKGGKP